MLLAKLLSVVLISFFCVVGIASAVTPVAPSNKASYQARVILPVSGRKSPSYESSKIRKIRTFTPWGGEQKLLIVKTELVNNEQWIKVLINARPNGLALWIHSDYAVITRTKWRITVNRKHHKLKVYYNGKLSKQWKIVVGKRSTPTPAGDFAVAGKIHQNKNLFEGSWIMPLSAHSNVLKHYDGGDGQVALHGRGGASLNDPLGTSRSHGCMRMNNSRIAWLARHVPIGTPVNIK